MSTVYIKNATIVNEGKQFSGSVLIENQFIKSVNPKEVDESTFDEVIDAKGMYLLPGMIDDQVHFREPGLTHKADIFTESRAAVAGGITSFMEMPNTVPNTLTQDLLQDKYDIAAESSIANYSFFFGASNDNLEEVLKTDKKTVCGVKVFMGSSTGNMLVDDTATLEALFKECELLIATHCEDEQTVRRNLAKYKELYGDNIPFHLHPVIRDEEACYKSSSKAVELATKHNTRLHILHISTGKETTLFSTDPLSEKRITAEACTHHLWFNDTYYKEKGPWIKWNPAVKSEEDRKQIIQAVKSGRIDVLATDHAPHTIMEKNNPYTSAPSGGPLVQHALVAYLQMTLKNEFTIEEVVQKFAHNVAEMFSIDKRGFIREGYYADLVLVKSEAPWEVTKGNLLYKCGWSPFEGTTFDHKVVNTFVNGRKVYDNGEIIEGDTGMRMLFNR
ncbi:dihydroorotase [Parvicella tangerina]|uniref:Allantoinase n=1 Tax=Parvicella tangerina TaxID=2829795 RepID=A0A916NGE4_9FLAO|nr:dihydroorotase [Parvicella tangerina]CAG5079661.1 Allantoinase [Parvicella tangerina]